MGKGNTGVVATTDARGACHGVLHIEHTLTALRFRNVHKSHAHLLEDDDDTLERGTLFATDDDDFDEAKVDEVRTTETDNEVDDDNDDDSGFAIGHF
mmetsp:Transcript_51199/g.101403  ORF Transcript_51199/g.101403 Transcript_51199/m.101403 type:complete len:97 (+) Transcript_51199:31-321(+)